MTDLFSFESRSIDLSHDNIIERQALRESNARTYARKMKLALAEAKGVYVKDVDGKQYLDFLACAGALPLGHNHPIIKDAIIQALNSDLPMQTLDLATPIKDLFVTELFDNLPRDLSRNAKIQFCGPSGSDAVEAAIKLVKHATGRSAVGAFRGGYHGMTHGSLSLMGNLGPKVGISGLMPDVHFFPFPYPYRYPMCAGSTENDHEACSRYLENVMSDPESGIKPLAGLVMEAVQGEGGVIPAPKAWIKEVRRITYEQEVPLVVDEVQTGLGRTGNLFAVDHSGVVPDVMVLSKAIGGGLPLAAIVYREDLDTWKPGAHAGTFRGNQLAMVTGLATMRFIRSNNLLEHVRTIGECFFSLLLKIQKDFPQAVGEVRGRGLMLGMELTNSFSPLAGQVQKGCLERGLIIELGGRNGSVIRFLPPLTVEQHHVELACEVLHEVIGYLVRKELVNK